MPTWATDWIWRWWWLDPYLHTAVLLASVVGAAFTSWAWWQTRGHLSRLRRRGVNGLRQSVLRLHLVTQTGIWWCQIILVCVSLGMMTLPVLPVAMYADHEGQLVLTMLFVRKLARLATSLLLLWMSVHKVRWLRRVA